MKGLGKILARYVLSAAGIALLLICLNAAVFFAFAVASFQLEPETSRRLGELAASVQWDGTRWTAERSTLEGDSCWSMLLSEDGDVLWSEALPKELDRHYTVSDAASFTRWYLSDYPVKVWKHEAGLFVTAQPRGSQWKQQMEMNSGTIDLLLHHTLPAFLVLNAAAALLLPLLFGLQLFRSAAPVAQGIADLAERRPVALSERGMLGGLGAGLNRASAQLQRQEQLLKKRDRTRTEWIAGVSHDIRTPLTLVLGASAQLEHDAALSEEARAKAHTIRIQGERIRTLVSDLNLASKLTYELHPLRIERFRPAELLRDAAAELLNSGLESAFVLEMDIPADCEALWLEGDVQLVGRAVRNLLSNSVRHNPGGCTAKLGLRRRDGFCCISVEDTGGGYPDKVLERFRHASEGAIEPHGLGLVIARQVAAAHGGVLSLRNTASGACAVLTLRAEMLPPPLREQRPAHRSPPAGGTME